MITNDLFEPTPQQLRRAEQALVDARNRRARQDSTIAARRTDPETSHAAALAAVPRSAGGRMLALTLLAQHGPATDFELEVWSGVKQTSIGVRRGQLVKLGYVQAKRNGYEYVKRPSPTKTPAQVWEVTEAGREFLRGALGAT